MKKLITLMLMSMVLMSCGKDAIKKKASELVGISASKLISKELKKDPKCSLVQVESESKLIGVELTAKLDKILKVNREADKVIAMERKSFIGDMAQGLCKSLITKHLPNMLLNKYESYECTMRYIGGKTEVFAEKVCSGIKL